MVSASEYIKSNNVPESSISLDDKIRNKVKEPINLALDKLSNGTFRYLFITGDKSESRISYFKENN